MNASEFGKRQVGMQVKFPKEKLHVQSDLRQCLTRFPDGITIPQVIFYPETGLLCLLASHRKAACTPVNFEKLQGIL